MCVFLKGECVPTCQVQTGMNKNQKQKFNFFIKILFEKNNNERTDEIICITWLYLNANQVSNRHVMEINQVFKNEQKSFLT